MMTAVRTLPLAVAPLAGIIGLIAVANPALAVILSLLIVLGVLMLADIRVGVCLFAFSAPLLDGVAGIGVSADKLVGMALALSWLASLIVRPSLRDELAAHAPVLLALLTLLGAWYTASLFWAEDVPEATQQLIRLLPNLLIVPIAVSAVNDARTLRWLITALLAGVIASTLLGLSGGLVEGRLAGSVLDANSLALWLIMASALAYGVVAGPVDAGVRMLVVAGITVCGVSVLATGSRTGAIALVAVLLAAPWLVRRRHRVVALLCTLVAIGGAVLYVTALAPEAAQERLTSSDVDSGSGRTSIWKVGLRMIEDKPIAGVGGGNFRISSIHYLFEAGEIQETRYFVDDPVGAHNTLMQVTAETGLIGGTLFALIVGLSVFYAARSARRFAAAKLPEYEVLSRATTLAFVGVLIGSLSVSVENSKETWLLIALGPIMYKLARRQGVVT